MSSFMGIPISLVRLMPLRDILGLYIIHIVFLDQKSSVLFCFYCDTVQCSPTVKQITFNKFKLLSLKAPNHSHLFYSQLLTAAEINKRIEYQVVSVSWSMVKTATDKPKRRKSKKATCLNGDKKRGHNGDKLVSNAHSSH